MEHSGKYFSKLIFASVAREHQRPRDLGRKAADQTQRIQYWKTFATSYNTKYKSCGHQYGVCPLGARYHAVC